MEINRLQEARQEATTALQAATRAGWLVFVFRVAFHLESEVKDVAQVQAGLKFMFSALA